MKDYSSMTVQECIEDMRGFLIVCRMTNYIEVNGKISESLTQKLIDYIHGRTTVRRPWDEGLSQHDH